MKTFKSILQLMEQFNTDMKCRQYLESKLWKDGKPVCPHCAVIGDCYRFADGRRFKCKSCKKQFTVTVGTIFEGKAPGEQYNEATTLACLNDLIVEMGKDLGYQDMNNDWIGEYFYPDAARLEYDAQYIRNTELVERGRASRQNQNTPQDRTQDGNGH